MPVRPGLIRALILATAIAVAGCGDAVGPFQPEITNATDSFQMQASGTAVTSVFTYAWTNTGTRATVYHGTKTTTGNAQLTIKDAAGAVVYNRPLATTLNEPTDAGAAGSWTILVTLTNFSGTVNFLARKL